MRETARTPPRTVPLEVAAALAPGDLYYDYLAAFTKLSEGFTDYKSYLAGQSEESKSKAIECMNAAIKIYEGDVGLPY